MKKNGRMDVVRAVKFTQYCCCTLYRLSFDLSNPLTAELTALIS